MNKVKVTIDPREPSDKAVVMSLEDAVFNSDWSDDPGTGKAVLLADGRELLNPVPHDPPIGYIAEISMMDRIDQQIRAHRRLLEDADVIDSAEELEDFGDDAELTPFSFYEMPMVDEFPGIPEDVVAKPEPVVPAAPAEPTAGDPPSA